MVDVQMCRHAVWQSYQKLYCMANHLLHSYIKTQSHVYQWPESHAAHKCIIQVSLGHSFFMPGFDLGLDFTSILENGISYVKDIKFSQLIKMLNKNT